MAAPDKSPMAELVDTLTHMARNRRVLRAMVPPADLKEFLEDVEMMLNEGVVIGLRSPWVRRVAVPAMKAHRVLIGSTGKPKDRALAAIDVLGQCTDEPFRETCIAWVRERYAHAE